MIKVVKVTSKIKKKTEKLKVDEKRCKQAFSEEYIKKLISFIYWRIRWDWKCYKNESFWCHKCYHFNIEVAYKLSVFISGGIEMEHWPKFG